MVLYVTDFVCTYHLMDDPEDADDSDKLFKLQFLQAFNYDITNSSQSLEEYFNTIALTTTKLYDLYKTNELIKKLIEKVRTSNSNYNNENDDFIIFQLCFSYSYFYITHKILCLIINTNNTNNTFHYQELLKIINRIK
jgi:hypothetical protein